MHVVSELWQTIGWNSIIYLAALAGINQELYDAAAVDGAGRFRRILSITIPCLMPTIIIMFIMRVGQFMSVGYDKIVLLYNENIYETADIIGSFCLPQGSHRVQLQLQYGGQPGELTGQLPAGGGGEQNQRQGQRDQLVVRRKIHYG